MIHLQYLRKSRDRREKDDPEVLYRHRAILLQLQQSKGVVVPPEHQFEEVRSGESIQRRPEFQRLLKLIGGLPDCPRDRVQGYLWCMDADRLSRGMLKEQGEIQELLIRKGVVLQTPAGATDLRDTDERLLHGVKGLLGNWEIGKYKDRVASARRQLVREGKVRNANVPFGYLWDRNKKEPVPHPAEFPVLAEAARLAFTHSVYQLAERYGVRKKKLLIALRSPMICGYPAKTTKPRPDGIGTDYLPRSEWLFVEGLWPVQEGTYPKAMELDEWLLLQECLDKRDRSPSRGRRSTQNHWCKDVIEFVDAPGPVCLGGYCKPGVKFPTYARNEKGRPQLYVPREMVHAAVLVAILPVLGSPLLLQMLTDLRAQQGKQKAPEEAALKQEQERLSAQLASIQRQEHDPDTHPAELPGLRALKTETLRSIDGVAAQLHRLRAQVPMLSVQQAEDIGKLAGFVRGGGFEEAWEEMQDEEKRLLVNGIVARVEVACVRPRPRAHAKREVAVRLQPWAEKMI